MTIHDWIGVLWLIAIITLYAYAYHIRTQHIKHKEHKENSQPAHIRIQNAIHQAHQQQATTPQHQNQTEINEINKQP